MKQGRATIKLTDAEIRGETRVLEAVTLICTAEQLNAIAIMVLANREPAQPEAQPAPDVIHVPRPQQQTGLRRYNLVPMIKGQPTNYEWEAADDGIAVQADEAMELQRVADEMAEALNGVLPYMEEAENAGLIGDEGCHWPVEFVRAALASYAALKGGQ